MFTVLSLDKAPKGLFTWREGDSPKGQKIAPLYMQSLVPRAIAIIENAGQAKYFCGKFNFPCVCLFGCDFFDFSRFKSSSTFFRVERLSLSSTTRLSPSNSFREMWTLLFSDCSELCSNDLASTERAKILPVLVLARSHYRLSRRSDGNLIPQKLTLLEG